ncbi:MAG: YbbR-like domain-containing protein [Christensenellales bacterium]|jgi:YbbR domain-containing protein
MRKFFSYWWGRLKHNWPLKLLSLVFAVIFWSYAVIQSNPLRIKNLNNVPVTVLNAGYLDEQELVMLQDILGDDAVTTNIRVEAHMDQLSRISTDNISVEVDLSQIKAPGHHSLPINVRGPASWTYTLSPQRIEVDVEKKLTHQVPVSVETQGRLAEGYWSAGPQSDMETIEVSGPESVVERIAKAQVTLQIDGLKNSVTASYAYVLLDDDGQPVQSENLTVSATKVNIHMDVLGVKEVPVNIEDAVLGTQDLPTGYEVKSVTVKPETVRVAGPEDILSTLESVSIESIDVRGSKESKTYFQPLKLPEGVQAVGVSEVTVTVQIGPELVDRTYNDLEITTSGLKSEYYVSALPKGQITLKVAKDQLALLDATPPVLYMDLSGLEVGTHQVEVSYRLPKDLIGEGMAVSPQQISVTIKASPDGT